MTRRAFFLPVRQQEHAKAVAQVIILRLDVMDFAITLIRLWCMSFTKGQL